MTTKHVPTGAEGTADLKAELQRLVREASPSRPPQIRPTYGDGLVAEALLELLTKMEALEPYFTGTTTTGSICIACGTSLLTVIPFHGDTLELTG